MISLKVLISASCASKTEENNKNISIDNQYAIKNSYQVPSECKYTGVTYS